MKQPESSSVARKFENLNNVFYLMVGLPLLLFAWTYLNLKLISPWVYFEEPLTGTFLHALILVVVIVLPVLAYKRYKKEIATASSASKDVQNTVSLREKVNVFISASLRFYYVLTISNILVVIGFYFSAEEFYIFFYSILLILYSINRPTPDRMVKELRFKKEEKEAFYQLLKNQEG